MTNRLELNWKLDGFVDEQRYYCSETPIDIENLPAPKAIIAGDARTYTDTAIEVGKTYYVAVASVRNVVEKLSEGIKVEALSGDEHWDKVVALLHFDGDLVDETGRVWTQHGSAIVSTIDPKFGSSSLSVPGTSGYIQTVSELIAGAKGNRLTVELFVKIRTLTRTGIIFDFRPTNSTGNYLGYRKLLS